MAAISSKLFQIPHHTWGKLTRVLSIDGGGVRGIIPTVFLDSLESQLQKLDGKDARIVDYFDVIGGSNTGALTAAMLTAPDQNNRPMFSAKDIKQFYHENYPNIYPQSNNFLSRAAKTAKRIFTSKYDSKYAVSLLKETFGDTKLNNTLTNIVIPTFNPLTQNIVNFSTYGAKENPSLNASLSDICMGSLAAPTYMHPHYFRTQDSNGQSKEFFLHFDSITGNNTPSVNTLYEMMLHKSREENENMFPIILSVGTCSPKYDLEKARKWFPSPSMVGALKMVFPVLDEVIRLIALVTDYEGDFYYGNLLNYEYRWNKCISNYADQEHYLRIQDDSLTGVMCSFDVATKQNLDDLVKFGERVLKKPVSRLDFASRTYVPISEETNEEALNRLAAVLSQDKRIRSRSS